jgi:hypothetical protein
MACSSNRLSKTGMKGFLGDSYEPVMQLLMTANTLQEEGPLFYVVSRYTPVPQLAEKADLSGTLIPTRWPSC